MPSAVLPHARVGCVPVFNGSRKEVIGFLREAVVTRSGAWVATANLDYIARARRDPSFAEGLTKACLVVADGAPVAWLARLTGAHRTERIAGVDLVAELVTGATDPLRVLLYGSTPRVAERAAAAFQASNPVVRVVGVVCPPFAELSEAEQAREQELIARLAPEIVLVALGCPKQEAVIARYRNACPSAVWIGVGGTFDFFAGRRRRAPRLVQRLGGEWVVRLAQEPGRLWRRYFLHDIPALIAVAPACLGARLRDRSTAPATE